MILHRNLAVVRVEDPHVFEEIRAVVPLDAWVLSWMSPTEAVLDPSRLKELLAALEARGMGALVRRGG